MITNWQIIRKPLLSEKSESRLKKLNIYSFMVDKKANKHQIKKAVEEIYGVKVEQVRTMIIKGKLKKMRNMVLMGQRADVKKAYITLKEGFRLDLI